MGYYSIIPSILYIEDKNNSLYIYYHDAGIDKITPLSINEPDKILELLLNDDPEYFKYEIYHILTPFRYFPKFRYRTLDFLKSSIYFDYNLDRIVFTKKIYRDNGDEKYNCSHIELFVQGVCDLVYSQEKYTFKKLHCTDVHDRIIEILKELNVNTYHSQYIEWENKNEYINGGITLSKIYDDLELSTIIRYKDLENIILTNKDVFELNNNKYDSVYVSYDSNNKELAIIDKDNLNRRVYLKRIDNNLDSRIVFAILER